MVDGLERDLKGVTFTKIDLSTDDGAAMASRYGISMVPAFVVLDGEGRVIYRQVGGTPKSDEIKSKVATLAK